MAPQIHYSHFNDPSPNFLKKKRLMHMPWADLQRQKSMCATLIIDCLFAGLPGLISAHTPCPGDDKNRKKRMHALFLSSYT